MAYILLLFHKTKYNYYYFFYIVAMNVINRIYYCCSPVKLGRLKVSLALFKGDLTNDLVRYLALVFSLVYY